MRSTVSGERPAAGQLTQSYESIHFEFLQSVAPSSLLSTIRPSELSLKKESSSTFYTIINDILYIPY